MMGKWSEGRGKAVRALAVSGMALRLLAVHLFGRVSWQRPPWLQALFRRLAHWGHGTLELIRKRPTAAAAVMVGILLLLGASYGGWRWWKNLPQPVLVTFEVPDTLPRTCYECEGTAAEPASLTIKFSASVAPLELAGKAIDPQKAGIHLSGPAPAGTWRWTNDRNLEFKPSADWPIGEALDVEFNHKGFVARHVSLDRYEFKTHTAPFKAEIANTEFYQDPVKAADKKAVFTINFSHPVDAADLEKHLKLNQFEKLSAKQERDAGAVAYDVSYDKWKLNAYVHSAQLTVPAKESRLELSVAKGIHALRGGNASDASLSARVIVPGLDSLSVEAVKMTIARDEQRNPSQVLLATLSFSVLESEMSPRIHAWVLPLRNPDPKIQAQFEVDHPNEPFDWSACNCTGGSAAAFDSRLIAHSEPMPLTLVPGELEHHPLHSFSFVADPKRFVYVRIDKGLTSFGGYRLGATSETLVRVPEYPRELRLMEEGSLMAMSGPKKLNLFSRDVPAMRVSVQRLLPHQLQHLVSQTDGRFSSPEFSNYRFDADNITEWVGDVEDLPSLKPGAPNYGTLDLGRYLKSDNGERRGIFLLHLQPWDKANKRPLRIDDASSQNLDAGSDTRDGEGSSSDSTNSDGGDTRLIVITDLGLLVKRNLDRTQDVFVQSIHSGAPVAGVELSVIGRNGEPVMTQTSDADGHARFADLKDFVREKQPVLYLARKDGDSSFMPIDTHLRQLDLSRFDVGGVANSMDRDALTAYLFSDRGLYRPGEEIRIGAIVKSAGWKPLQGVPLSVEITDPLGSVVRKQRLVLGAGGFEELRYSTKDSAPAGNYTVNVSIDRNKNTNSLIGSLTVQVRDFQPDRMKMTASLSARSAEGWVSPDDLKANVLLQNLFGTPAQQRRVKASITLKPAFPSFPAYRDFAFFDPQMAKDSFNEDLPDAQTDDDGAATLALNLQRFDKATYQLQLLAQGFEADGGRGVAVQATQLVSSMPYLVGYKADGDLNYIVRQGARSVELIAIDPQAQKTQLKDLKLSLLKIVYTSVLEKQANGTYRYESRRKEVSQKESSFQIASGGSHLSLPTVEPGSFAYVLRDGGGQQLARVEFQVVGDANLTRSLEKNAELKMVLSKHDYAAGDDVEVQITAPYAGSGLITIERDKVYAWRWFHSETTASTQRIHLPEGIEGNAYLSVSFVRDPGSPEIHMSPLSYGVAPFSVALDARRNAVHLSVPDKLKPGETAKFHYRTDAPSHLVMFAVDEGILQVARYQAPDPLGHFFQKRSLDVSTRQILDLILPEFRGAAMAAAPGGDADNLLARHLNPFKRKGDKPIAWWSGIVEADATDRELDYAVPDYFNGSLRVFAVAVSDDAIGVADGRTAVRGDFVLSPNAPTTVAPGDEFEVSVGISNNVEGSGKDAKISVSLESTAGLQVLGERTQSLPIGEARESSARFRLKATDTLGSADLTFGAHLGAKSARRKIDLSVRPSMPYRVDLTAGSIAPGKHAEFSAMRSMFAPARQLDAGLSVLPLALAHGYAAYLGRYPYSCTEQLMSMAMPGIVLSQRPEFSSVKMDADTGLDALVDELRARQNPDGAYRYWPGGAQVEEFVSIYAQSGLVEAADRGMRVPRDLLDHGNQWLQGIAARDNDSLEAERNSAYALYLLTRQGQVMGAESAGLRQRLEQNYGDDARHDIAWAYLASAMQLMKQASEAETLFGRASLEGTHAYDHWRDPMVWDAQLLYLTARHFPQRLAKLPPSLMDNLVQRTRRGEFHSLSAGSTLLALDAYARAVGETSATSKLSLSERLADGKTSQVLPLPDVLLPSVAFAAAAKSLHFENASDLTAYYVVSQSGFDRGIPTAPITNGFEILHEYTDSQGKPVTTVKMGSEINVHLKFRTNQHAAFTDAALVDLLPGGFELVVQPQDIQQQVLQAVPVTDAPEGEADAEGDDADEEGEGAPSGRAARWTRWLCPVCVEGTTGYPQYADFREDRLVFYTTVTPSIREIIYRIKATNVGSYLLPPAAGASMYEPTVQAQSVAGRIVVEAP